MPSARSCRTRSVVVHDNVLDLVYVVLQWGTLCPTLISSRPIVPDPEASHGGQVVRERALEHAVQEEGGSARNPVNPVLMQGGDVGGSRASVVGREPSSHYGLVGVLHWARIASAIVGKR